MTFNLRDLERKRLDRCALNSTGRLTRRRAGPVSLAQTEETLAFTTNTDAKAHGTCCRNALVSEALERPAKGLQGAVALAYVCIFNAQATDPERLAGDIPFVKLCLAVLELEEVHHA